MPIWVWVDRETLFLEWVEAGMSTFWSNAQNRNTYLEQWNPQELGLTSDPWNFLTPGKFRDLRMVSFAVAREAISKSRSPFFTRDLIPCFPNRSLCFFASFRSVQISNLCVKYSELWMSRDGSRTMEMKSLDTTKSMSQWGNGTIPWCVFEGQNEWTAEWKNKKKAERNRLRMKVGNKEKTKKT